MSDGVISLEELAAALARGEPLTLLDVREADELEAARVPGAVHLPLGALAALTKDAAVEHPLLPASRPIVTFCAAGGRALRARSELERLGRRDVRAATQGITEWLARGYPALGDAVLTPDDAARYARQVRLPEVGARGQARLARARVAVIGAGGLGCPTLLYLGAAGVGHLTVIDEDRVALDNLHRQVLYRTEDVGARKTHAARVALLARTPGLAIATHETRLTRLNARELLAGHDVLVDATDNYAARSAVNLASCELQLPAVFGAVSRFEGQLTTRVPGQGPCYACLHPQAPEPALAPTCADEGVLGVVPGLIGLLQAQEVLKLLLGYGQPLVGVLLHLDARSSRFRRLTFEREPSCAACGMAEPGEREPRAP